MRRSWCAPSTRNLSTHTFPSLNWTGRWWLRWWWWWLKWWRNRVWWWCPSGGRRMSCAASLAATCSWPGRSTTSRTLTSTMRWGIWYDFSRKFGNKGPSFHKFWLVDDFDGGDEADYPSTTRVCLGMIGMCRLAGSVTTIAWRLGCLMSLTRSLVHLFFWFCSTTPFLFLLCLVTQILIGPQVLFYLFSLFFQVTLFIALSPILIIIFGSNPTMSW